MIPEAREVRHDELGVLAGSDGLMNGQNSSQIPRLPKADSVTLAAYADKSGKISVSFSGWDANKVVWRIRRSSCAGGHTSS
jgi:hypothetical protein